MKKVIGIISYLPDDPKIRQARLVKLQLLVEQCNSLFGLPITIIAQNWKEDVHLPANVTLCSYEQPLGITGARRELRKWFLQSPYDYLIMLDDDCELVGTPEAALSYLKQIDAHPDMYGKFRGTLLKLFAISKEMYSKVDYPDLEPIRGEMFEDIFIVNLLDKLYGDKCFQFNVGGLNDTSVAVGDSLSTWYKGQYERHDIGDRTRALLKEM